MKDVFAKRSVATFFELAGDFAESCAEAFPECQATRDWKLWMTNVVGDDEAQRKQIVEKWVENARRPLKKGSAKYLKAVHSITGEPATLYHAVTYHDAEATHSTDEMLQDLDVPSKLKAMDEEARKIFWQYLEEMNQAAFRATRATLPKVPTVQQIADDIAKRKRVADATTAVPGRSVGGKAGEEPRLHHGLWEIWQQLCESRGNTLPASSSTEGTSPPSEVLATALASLLQEHDGIVRECRERTGAAQEVLFARFSELRGDKDLSEEEWSLIEKALNLTSMERSIPPAMMNGIESVAQQLMQDLESGNCDLSSLNLDQIGQQVLHSVSPDDVTAFASNLDKILPALERIHGGSVPSTNS